MIPKHEDQAGGRRALASPLNILVASTLLLGGLLGGAVILTAPSALLVTQVPLSLAMAVLAVTAALSEVAYVRVPHGDSTEDLTFFEVVLVTAAIVMPAAQVLVAALAGLAGACILLRRPLVKTLFNVGTYAAGSAALLLVTHAIAGSSPADSLDARLVVGLLAGTVAFACVNLLALAVVLAVVEGKPPREWLQEEWSTSTLIVFGSVGVGTVAVQLALSDPVLMPFTAMPVLALMHSYRASRHHAQASERANALVELNSVLATQQSPQELAEALAPALRKLFDVDHVLVTLPGTEVAEDAGAPADSIVVPLDLGDETGRLVLSRDGRALTVDQRFRSRDKVDLPMLGAVASALASVLRAGRHLAALTEESSKLQGVIDHATDGIAVVDSAGAILVWSPSMRELVGEPPAQVAHAEGQDAVVALLASLSTAPERTASVLVDALPPKRPRAKTNVTVLGRRGDERDMDVSVARIERPDGNRLAVVSLRDATQERRLEKMKADFVATVSHELKTPITPIKGYARLLASRGDRMEPARRLHALQLIEDRADHLSRLVDDLLLASRVPSGTTGKLNVDMGEADMRHVVRQAVSAYPLLSHRLEVSICARAMLVRCDLVRAVQCMTNLIGNAEKYSPGESPIQVELIDDTTDGWVRAVVTDYGRGIPPAQLDAIFERFHRVEDPFTMSTSGSGLGLYIARELARAMGGDISVTSTLGEGSAFTFRLPIHEREGNRPAGPEPMMVA